MLQLCCGPLWASLGPTVLLLASASSAERPAGLCGASSCWAAVWSSLSRPACVIFKGRCPFPGRVGLLLLRLTHESAKLPRHLEAPAGEQHAALFIESSTALTPIRRWPAASAVPGQAARLPFFTSAAVQPGFADSSDAHLGLGARSTRQWTAGCQRHLAALDSSSSSSSLPRRCSALAPQLRPQAQL